MVDRALQGPLGRFTGDSECCAAAAADFFFLNRSAAGGSGGAGSPSRSPVLSPGAEDSDLWGTLPGPGFIEGPAPGDSGLTMGLGRCRFEGWLLKP